MSLIPHHHLPRSMFDMDLWSRPEHLGLGPSTLDVFDPFDELDHMIGRNLMWLNKPDFIKDLIPSVPRVPEKFRISVDVRGYNVSSLKTELSDDRKQLFVSGHEEQKGGEGSEDYVLKEFRKAYKVPENAEVDKMVSFLTSHHHLIIEIPLKIERDDHFPRIIDDENGKKHIEMNLHLPANIDPSHIKVTCKDRDIIIHGEDKIEKPDSVSKITYYRRTTLPENTDFNSIKCIVNSDTHKMSVKAPLNIDFKHFHKRLPVEMGGESKKLALEQEKK